MQPAVRLGLWGQFGTTARLLGGTVTPDAVFGEMSRNARPVHARLRQLYSQHRFVRSSTKRNQRGDDGSAVDWQPDGLRSTTCDVSSRGSSDQNGQMSVTTGCVEASGQAESLRGTQNEWTSSFGRGSGRGTDAWLERHFESKPAEAEIADLRSVTMTSPRACVPAVIEPPAGEVRALMRHPDRCDLHKQLMRARSHTAVLNLVQKSGCRDFSLEHTALALKRLAQCGRSTNVRSDVRFAYLLDHAAQAFALMSTVSLCQTVTAIIKLKCSPVWMPSLLACCGEHTTKMRARQATAVLHAIAEIPFQTKQLQKLREDLFGVIERRFYEVENSSDLCSLAVAFGQWRYAPPTVLPYLLYACTQRISSFDLEDIASLAWFLARVPSTNATRKVLVDIRHHLEQQLPEQCKMDILVSLTWSLGKTRCGSYRFFTACLTPRLLKGLHGATKTADLVKLCWAYARQGVEDAQLIPRIVDELKPRLAELTGQRIARLVWALSRFKLGDSDIFYKLAEQSNVKSLVFPAECVPETLLAYAKLGVSPVVYCDRLIFRAEYHLRNYSVANLYALLLSFVFRENTTRVGIAGSAQCNRVTLEDCRMIITSCLSVLEARCSMISTQQLQALSGIITELSRVYFYDKGNLQVHKTAIAVKSQLALRTSGTHTHNVAPPKSE